MAGAQADTPYTKDIENGARLSALLINEGTLAVQHMFDSQIKSKHNTLFHALNHSSVKSKMDAFYSGNGKPKLLNKTQYQLMYPVGGSCPQSKSFDLTLLTFLFRNMLQLPPPKTKNWRDEPDDADNSLSADLVRLRIFRNSMYGHITTTGLDDKDFEEKWNYLSNILHNLGVSHCSIDRWKAESMSIKDKMRYEQQLTTLMENDIADMHSMVVAMKLFLAQHSRSLADYLHKVEDSVNEIKKANVNNKKHNRNMEFLMAGLLNILSALPCELSQVILEYSQIESQVIVYKAENILRQQNKLIKQQDTIITRTNEIQQTLEHQTESIQKVKDVVAKIDNDSLQTENKITEVSTSIETKLEQSTEKIVADIHKLKLELSESLIDCSTVTELKDKFTKDNDAFRVLIINQPDKHLEHVEELCFALGCTPWDVIIDLNHDSRTSTGLHDKIAATLRQQKDFEVVTYLEASRVGDADKDIISQGMKTLWILANGCADIGCVAPGIKFGKAIAEIIPLLKGILNRLPGPKALFCTNLILGNNSKRPIKQLCEAIAVICESVEDRINYSDSSLVHIYTDITLKELIPENEYDLQHSECSLTCNQLFYTLSECFSIDEHTQKYYYPGDQTWCIIKSEEIVKLQPYVTLYHRDIGKITFKEADANSDVEDTIDKIRFSFLKGNTITPEGFYIHENWPPVYVARKDMQSAKEIVEKHLDDFKVWSKRTKGYFQINHEASGGGTTTAKYILYQLREKYPCLQVLKIDGHLIEILKKLSVESRKPLLLMIDDRQYEISDVSTLKRRLENERIMALLMRVERSMKKKEIVEHSRNDSYFISSTLEHESDKFGFKMLYSTIKKKIEANKVFLFGLYAFCEEYVRTETHVKACLESMSMEEKKIIFTIYMIEQYGGIATPVRLLNNLIVGGKKLKSIFEILEYGNDLLNYNKSESTMRPIHRCVLSFMLPYYQKECKMEELLKNFISALSVMFGKNDASKEDSLPLSHFLFIKRNTGEHYTKLVHDIEEHCGRDNVAEVLLQFTTIYKGIRKEEHMRALYARYLFYNLKREQEGIEQISKAIGLKTKQSVAANEGGIDSSLLCTYGSIMKAKAFKTFQASFKSCGVDIAICNSLSDYEEAVSAFSLAQNVKKIARPHPNMSYVEKYSPQPFLGDAMARSTLLSLCFYHKCNRNHEKFRKFLRETDHSFIAESEKQVIDTLDRLGLAIRLDRVDDNDPQGTSRQIMDLKFKILRFRYDSSTTKGKLLSTLPTDVPCDIGLLVRLNAASLDSINYGNQLLKICSWEDLSVDELELIINLIDKRITSDSMLACNYSDMIKAMQTIRQLSKAKKYKKYNLDYALECAKQWSISFPNEPSAHFKYGSLLLIKGIEDENQEVVRDGIKSLSRSNELCTENPSFKSARTMIYTIGNGDGLERLMQYKKSEGKGKLMSFCGRQIKKKLVCVKPFQSFMRATLWDNNDIADINQQPELKFNICLRMKDPIVAFNVERVTGDDEAASSASLM